MNLNDQIDFDKLESQGRKRPKSQQIHLKRAEPNYGCENN